MSEFIELKEIAHMVCMVSALGQDPCYRSFTRSVARGILQDTEFNFSMYSFRCESIPWETCAVGHCAPVLREHHKKRLHSSAVPGPAIKPRATLGCRCCASGKTVTELQVQEAQGYEIVSSAHRPLLILVILR